MENRIIIALVVGAVFFLFGRCQASQASIDQSGSPTAGHMQFLQVAGLGDFFRKLDESLRSSLPNKSENSGSPPANTAPRSSHSNSHSQASGGRSPSPKPLNLYGLTREQNREIQALLTELEYSPGPADGLPGKKTRLAIKRYQSDQGLLITGQPSLALLEHMQARVDTEKQQAPTKMTSAPEELASSAPSGEPANSVTAPSDILYSSIGNNENYGEYRKIFTDQRIKKLVASVERHRSVELNYRILAAFMKIYGREATVELGDAPRMKEVLARLDSGKSNNEGVFRSLELLLEQVATENGLQYSDMRIFNDARNINQPEIAAIEDVALDPSWRLLPPHEAAFHVLGYDPETIRKYVSDDGKELVFQLRDNHWVFIKDGVNTGTYNYSTKKIAHFVLDMAPWVLWGTGAEERLTKEKRLDVAREEFKPYVNAKIAELESQLQGAGKELLKKAADNMIAAAGMVKTATAAVGAKAAGALDDLDSIAIFLKANYPDTYEYIQNYSPGDDAVKKTQLKIAYVIAKFVQSPKVGATISERLGLDAKGFVKFATTRSTSSMVKSGISVSKDIAGSMLEDAIVSTAAALATDVFFKIEPMESVAQNLEGPLRAMVESSLVEMYYAQKALKDPTVIISRLFDRYQQVRKIVATSRSLARTQDRGLLAAALTADTAAYLVTKFPTEKSIKVAEATLQDTKANIKDIVGKDDDEAVWHIVQLGYDAMKANYIGNTQEKEAKIVEIKRLGRVSGNIYPWSSIVHPVDWLTAAANWGKDAPERAAEIVLGSTSLVSDAKIATSSSAGNSTPVLPAEGAKSRKPSAAGQTKVVPRCNTLYANPFCTVCDLNELDLYGPGNPGGNYRVEWQGTCDGVFDEEKFNNLIDEVVKFIEARKARIVYQGFTNSPLEDRPSENNFPGIGKTGIDYIIGVALKDYDQVDVIFKLMDYLRERMEGIYQASGISIRPTERKQLNMSPGEILWNVDILLLAPAEGSVGLAVGYGKLRVYKDGKDYFELVANEETGIKFEVGTPKFDIAPQDIDIYYSSRKGFSNENQCPSARYPHIWAVVDSKLQTQAKFVTDKIITVARRKALEQCPSLKNSRYKLQIIKDTTVSAWGGIEKLVSRWIGGSIPSDMITCEGQVLSHKNNCDRGIMNRAFVQHNMEMNSIYSQRVQALKEKAEKARLAARKKAAETEKNRIQSLKTAAEEKWKKKWTSDLNSDSSWENLTDLLRFNKPAVIAKLAKGHLVRLKYRANKVAFNEGKSVLEDTHIKTDIYKGLNKGQSYFEAWSAAVNRKPNFDVYCILDPEELVGLNEGKKYDFMATLKRVNEAEFGASVTMDCKIDH